MSTVASDVRDEILVSLANDPRYPPGTHEYAALAHYLPDALLAAAGGELDAPFTVEAYLDIKAALLRILAQSNYVNLAMHRGRKEKLFDHYTSLAELYERMAGDLPAFLQWTLVPNLDYFVRMLYPALYEPLLDDYHSGTLTVRQVVTLQPGFFMPTS